MALTINSPEAERLASELAQTTGETQAEAVTKALRDRLLRVRRARGSSDLIADLEKIADHCSNLPVIDPRTPEEILGYDEAGLPH